MKRKRSIRIPWADDTSPQMNYHRYNNKHKHFSDNLVYVLRYRLLLWLSLAAVLTMSVQAEGCPPSEAILPCRCSLRGKEIQIWCSHSNLPQIMDGIKAVERNIKTPIDELVLENNQLPALPGRFFGALQIVRLMLRYNSIERVSNGWLNEMENHLVEVYIVEPQLRSIPVESLNGMINMIAITIQSDELKHLPDFSGLLSLTYLSVQSESITELQPHWFRHLPKVQNVHINGGPNLIRLESGTFDSLISLKNIDLSRNALNWVHLRALSRLPNLVSLKLSYNEISDVGMVGRIVKDLDNLKKLRLDHNIINIVEDGSFVDLPHLSELHLNDNRITEIEYGAFLHTPMLKTIYLHNNHIRRIHPESFLQASGSGVETVYAYNNEIEHVSELRSLLDALPSLKFLDMSNNYLTDVPFGALRGHGTLEQLHLNNNLLRTIERDALMAMPALRELRMRNNSLSSELPMPFWNLPGLKGLDLAANNFRTIDSYLLAGLPSLRRLDVSENGLLKLDPTTFIHNPMLETLNISYNELVKIHPATFRNLNRLFEVDASYNLLTDIIPGLPKIVERISMRGNAITTLPFSIGKSLSLPNLRMLDLSVNRLEQLPKYGFQGMPQLRVLSLANNRLRSLDDTAFIGATRLELLHLQDNGLTHIDERTLLPLAELRNFNLQGNKLESITDNLFSNNSRLEQLDLSRNMIRTIAPSAFESQRSLEYLDLSSNALSDISVSLSNLVNLHDIDLSYNQITRVQADVVSSWRNVVEIRLANNLIVELKHGTFRNLPKLQYLDLSSNEISTVEPGALKHLPDLQEFVLADNKLVELKDHVFEDLPNLLASHFQYNTLRYISPDSFFNSPSMVFLNLSNNNFHNMENIGLRAMRNLEVLDLSTNGVRMVNTMPLKSLNWLVELKMDNNQICKIQGGPFETMPRLRVLSMRNNRLRTIKERTFRNLRGNIAILDVDGNPINCSCEMQWLSVWLQETNFPYPGPKCQDGRLLRTSRIDRSLCSNFDDTNQRAGTATDNSFSSDNANHLPLLNEHGDVFQRDLQEEFNEECEVYDMPPGERPLAGESEYFYDQYVDYTPSNETSSFVSTDAPSVNANAASNSVLSTQKKPPISANIDLNNTILNTNYFKRHPQPAGTQATSPFTFFGYPIPSLSLGRFFGAGQRGRKDRGENTSTPAARQTFSSSTESGLGTMPATHRMHTPHGKVRMYQPNSAEFEKYLNQPDSQYHDVSSRNKHTTTIATSADSSSDETTSSDSPSSVFKTAFREPTSVERGGFRPIMPAHVGGFMPVHDPSKRRGVVEPIPTPTKYATKHTERNYIPLVPVHSDNNQEKTNRQPNLRDSTGPSPTVALTTAESASEEFESQTYYVTENPTELTTDAPHITPPYTPATTPTTFSSVGMQKRRTTTTPSSSHSLSPAVATVATTPTPFHTTTTDAPASFTAATSTSRPTTVTQASTYNADESDAFDSAQFYDDLEAQSVVMLKPPPLLQTTTAETILLIPPPEEHVEQIKRNSWILKSPTTTTEITPNKGNNDPSDGGRASLASAEPATTPFTPTNLSPRQPRPSGGRSIITKVETPQANINQYLPTAEEYHRTTPHNANGYVGASASGDHQALQQQQQQQLLANAHKRDFNALEAIDAETVDTAATAYQQVEQANRKEGMDWYYESFKKPRPVTAAGGSLRSSANFVGSGVAEGWKVSPCRNRRLAYSFMFLLGLHAIFS
ncbi:protein artichoke [Ceratitis capitata]|uniref:protein artichoke n=1 Tax=Ceratitis capitata TaxID=7213 RepID=UPI0006188353|nr:protein artichoke [Ceratitis capitata]XP_020713342.1 protein artichoke [Ceratitis capitata]XP_020713343.1 protein artichoke [Ceratitis capitata]